MAACAESIIGADAGESSEEIVSDSDVAAAGWSNDDISGTDLTTGTDEACVAAVKSTDE